MAILGEGQSLVNFATGVKAMDVMSEEQLKKWAVLLNHVADYLRAEFAADAANSTALREKLKELGLSVTWSSTAQGGDDESISA